MSVKSRTDLYMSLFMLLFAVGFVLCLLVPSARPFVIAVWLIYVFGYAFLNCPRCGFSTWRRSDKPWIYPQANHPTGPNRCARCDLDFRTSRFGERYEAD